MISGLLYQPIINNTLLVICVIYFLIFYSYQFKNSMIKDGDKIISLIICIAYTLFIGLRPLHPIFGDSANYAVGYYHFQNGGELSHDGDWFFYAIMKFCSGFMSVNEYFLLMAIFYIGFTWIACIRLFPRYTTVAFLANITAFSFWAYCYNGMRNGLAASIAILAFSFMNRKLICACFCVLAIMIHKSMMLPLMSFVLSYYFCYTKLYFKGWVIAIALSSVLGGAMESILAGSGLVEDERFSSYLTSTEFASDFSRTGFRWDFLLYSSVPVIIGYYVIIKKGLRDRKYEILLNTYIIANAFWILIIRASFSNRFAYLSWFLYPIVLIYPFISFPLWKEQHKKVAYTLWLHFSFTYFMWTFY